MIESEPTVTILIGPAQERFVVPITRIKNNTYFGDDVLPDAGDELVIGGARWQAIFPDRFEPVYEWLKYGDYDPEIHEDCDSLEGITTDLDHEIALRRCGRIFNLARQLRLLELMDLVRHKYMLLKKTPQEVLTVVNNVFDEEYDGSYEDQVMRDLLVKEVADNWPVYVVTQWRQILRQIPFRTSFYKQVQLRDEQAHGLWRETYHGTSHLFGTAERKRCNIIMWQIIRLIEDIECDSTLFDDEMEVKEVLDSIMVKIERNLYTI